MLPFQLGEPYRPDAGRDIRLDDATAIGPLFQRAHVHRHVRPARPRDAPDERRGAGVAVRKENVAGKKHRRERQRIGSGRRGVRLDRLGKVNRQGTDQAAANSAEER
jgi:hypothetical protein